ncbi:MAG: hypothetical protein A2252_08280 [Elusimicrobia bacterium RIFOXYA2_FULL_39_19]|nr:MAG: hypothetical protein A2252_08280 [Elusimicrobia bacterium RIFOXYA2_FULL_39_19]
MDTFLLSFIPIFAAMNPFGKIPTFIMLSKGLGKKEKSRVIRDSVITAFLVGIGFIFIGKLVFKILGITTYDFMVAGGILLLVLSINDIIKYIKEIHETDANIGVVPLGIPLITGPAVLATLLMLTDSQGIVSTVVSFIVNISICAFVLIQSEFLTRLIGSKGSLALAKVSNLLLAAIAVMIIRKGIFGIIGR